jgi:hypothetical protein
LQVQDVVQVSPYSGARARYLHLMSKVSPTPERFRGAPAWRPSALSGAERRLAAPSF